MEEDDVDPALGLLAIARANEIKFSVANEPVWFPFSFKDRIVHNLSVLEHPGRTSITHPAVPVRYCVGWRDEGTSIVALLVSITPLNGCFLCSRGLERYCHDGTDLFQIPSNSKQSQFVPSLGANNDTGAGSNDLRGVLQKFRGKEQQKPAKRRVLRRGFPRGVRNLLSR